MRVARRQSTRLLGSIMRIGAAVALFLVVSIMFFEHRWIYYPHTGLAAEPAVAFEDVAFDADDGTPLHGWFFPAGGARALIVSHGNGGNIGHRADMGEFLRLELGAAVLLYDYRGYGQSGGQPSEQGTYSDIRGAFRLLRSRGYAATDIFLLGQSLGAAVAVDLAADVEVGGVILEAPFTSIGAMARKMFYLPLGRLVRTRYDSLGKIARIRAPIAIVHARNDPIVPFSMGEELFEAAMAPKRFFAVDGEVHEGAMGALGLERLGALREFMGLDHR